MNELTNILRAYAGIEPLLCDEDRGAEAVSIGPAQVKRPDGFAMDIDPGDRAGAPASRPAQKKKAGDATTRGPSVSPRRAPRREGRNANARSAAEVCTRPIEADRVEPGNVRRRDSGGGEGENPSPAREYLYVGQLAALTPWTPEAIRTKMRRGQFKRGVHYFKPEGPNSRPIFCWTAILEYIKGVQTKGNDEQGIPLADGTVIDVE